MAAALLPAHPTASPSALIISPGDSVTLTMEGLLSFVNAAAEHVLTTRPAPKPRAGAR